MFKRGDVAVETEPRDDANTGFRRHGVLADCFAFVNITDVHFDRREVATGQCVAQGETGVGECARIDNQTEYFRVREFADFIDNEAFVVGLVKLHLHTQFGSLFSEQIFEVRERLIAIDGRFTFTEAI